MKDLVTGYTLTTYRRRLKSDVWHWKRGCSNYPKRPTKFVDCTSDGPRPGTGELCDQCKSIEKISKGRS